jgi:hypothetical protein
MEDVTVPNLPGYVDNDVEGDNFHKSHLFDVLDGLTYVESNKFEEKPSTVPTIPAGRKFYGKEPETNASDRNAIKKISTSVKSLPRWITFGDDCLNFMAWTSEDVVFSNEESIRYRKFQISYFLADSKIVIQEQKFENSGIDQGIFLKKQKVPANDADRWLNWDDFSVGSVITIFGREFNIVSCDSFTRARISRAV